MRCIRIFPETWARTLWPLSISTRNIALGSGSTTLPSTSIASSLLMAFQPFIGVLDGRPMWIRAEMTTGAPNSMALATWTRRHGQEGADTRKHITHPAPALIGFLAGKLTASSLEDDLHELGHLLVAVVFRLDADDPAGLKV